ncbi:LLM class flavin-dependent oxidoreductase [Pseudomonas sp. M5]|uniref:LLM class flavin-dependent oxidoreductase n=1 Tax=Pseudomonas sp. M5 TaxID=1620788 RepID=UPI001959F8A1|nr:LLM class flavin-dependent oxidoreductase [Pseudomonas sp. M5]MBM7396535.1 alkanesulfonate monooxygenase SsuD/methylene tetrahydromethanopterin reductase-like flavin-dependent oxidoreductase (luciferase family) [Pseudomonas sp. M5]HDS1754479.1 LLM class flavin-dependent oxidoreductase [Pseudomonas putida]
MTAMTPVPRKQNPVRHSKNKIKLGVFGFNIEGGCTLTNAPERHHAADWQSNVAIAQMADRAGMEMLLPVGRWRGWEGDSNPMGVSYETYTWAAGLASVTEQIALFTTSHLSTVHPLFAAKQAATIDHISGGRFGLNIICGWFGKEMGMFNGLQREHDRRYDHADEWLEIALRAWGEQEAFDFQGDFFQIAQGYSQPKPLNQPFLMNAGGSTRGRRFCTQHCDAAFLILKHEDDDDTIRAQINAYRDQARIEFGREIQIWVYAYVVQEDSLAEAERKLQYYANEQGDDAALDNVTREIGIQSGMFKDAADAERFRFHFKAGFAGVPLVGTAPMIVEQMQRWSDLGVDGLNLTWLDYRSGLARFVDEVMPLMEQAGQRQTATSIITAPTQVLA